MKYIIALLLTIGAFSAQATTPTKRLSLDIGRPENTFVLGPISRGSSEYIDCALYIRGDAYPTNDLSGYLFYSVSNVSTSGVYIYTVDADTINGHVYVQMSTTDSLGLSTNSSDYPITYHAELVLTNATQTHVFDVGELVIRWDPATVGAGVASTFPLVLFETDPHAVLATGARAMSGDLDMGGQSITNVAAASIGFVGGVSFGSANVTAWNTATGSVGTTYTAGTNLVLSGTEFSVDGSAVASLALADSALQTEVQDIAAVVALDGDIGTENITSVIGGTTLDMSGGLFYSSAGTVDISGGTGPALSASAFSASIDATSGKQIVGWSVLTNQIALLSPAGGTYTGGTNIDVNGTIINLDAAAVASDALADSATQPADSVTTLDGTANRLLWVNGSGDVAEIALGAAADVLTSAGTTSVPTWETPSAGGGGSTSNSWQVSTTLSSAATVTVSSAEQNLYYLRLTEDAELTFDNTAFPTNGASRLVIDLANPTNTLTLSTNTINSIDPIITAGNHRRLICYKPTVETMWEVYEAPSAAAQIDAYATGTVTSYTNGGYNFFDFTGSGDFIVTAAGYVNFLLVGGGGGGAGSTAASAYGAGGGGGGGVIEETSVYLEAGTYAVVIGTGGAGGSANGTAGSDSTFNGYTSVGGGEGAGLWLGAGGAGGSGGAGQTAGVGTAGQGYNGGLTWNTTYGARAGGGGGGGSAIGSNAASETGGAGGAGKQSQIRLSVETFGGGGGGGADNAGGTAGGGGAGGGGAGQNNAIGTAGTVNTGGGGGGGGGITGGSGYNGGAGGSGILSVRYLQ
tara:strand:+ start:244 stop:2652 length:2409 start_codon:yes stop_codon:yes gene_type:complete